MLRQDLHGSSCSSGGDSLIPKAAPWKKDRVTVLTEIINQDGVLGIVDVEGVPATAMLGMRETLRDQMVLTMAKKTLIRRAWKQAGRSTDELDQLLDGVTIPMLVQTDGLNAFQLYAELDKTRTGRAAKAGDIAPNDIVIEAGPTSFPPGPIVGEFNSVGIPAKIDKGKVAIQKTVTAVEKGQPISADLGLMLSKLEINPIEIGLILSGAIEDGTLMAADDLNLDLDGFIADVKSATSGAFNVACHVGWFTNETVPVLVSKAAGEALAVAVEAGVHNEDTMPILMSRAHARMLALAGQLDSSALDDELSGALGAAATVAAATPAATDDAVAEEAVAEEEEEEEEDAGFGGLGDLFG
ncbi:MAG: 50S ribosomal protein L10 [Candidatus Thermoplasmatota archaeon]|nr:50S ribosomal protein L10 [Candidatus Thermoplasmatota archaeon]